MNIQEVIENITYQTPKFPKKEFQFLVENKEEAKPLLRNAIQYAIDKREDLDENYVLHFYALFLLGEFRDKDIFETLLELVSSPPETVDYLLGDVVTEGLADILYNTYNGDLSLIKNSIRNAEIDDFVRGAMLDVMAQLFLDQALTRKEWQTFLRELIHTEELGEHIYTEVLGVICKCHFFDMRSDIYEMFEQGLVDEYVYGKYEDCIDILFDYQNGERFCVSPMSAADMLRHWAMFERDEEEEAEFDQMRKLLQEEIKKSYSARDKVGRNDPCPCGSGKKYKHCCLNKPKDGFAIIESEQEQKKWLQDYPELTSDKIEGRIYLEDFYDAESIEIDKDLYLALQHRAVPMRISVDVETVANRKRAYLWRAYGRFVKKMEKEQCETAEEYDEKFAIHYRCVDWLGELLDHLNRKQDHSKWQEVSEYIKGIL